MINFRLAPGLFAAAILVTAFLPLSASAQARQKRQPPPAPALIGVQLYSVRDDCAKDFPGTLKAIAKMGFSGVEFAGFYGRTAEEVKQMLDDDHLKCYGSHISLDDLLGDNFQKTVQYNNILGNKLLVVPGLSGERRNTKAALIETAKLFNELAGKLDLYGFSLAFHDEPDSFTKIDGEYPWDIFFDNTNKHVWMQFDIGNALQGGVQAAPFLAKYPERVISVHVKDFSKTNPKALLGEGDENWKDVLALLKFKARPHWFIIEQETYSLPPLQCVEKCLRNFQKMIGPDF